MRKAVRAARRSCSSRSTTVQSAASRSSVSRQVRQAKGPDRSPNQDVGSRGSASHPQGHSNTSQYDQLTNESYRSSSIHGGVDDEGGSDDLHEVIMALDIRDNNKLGCAWYIAREEKMYLIEDVPGGGLPVAEICE